MIIRNVLAVIDYNNNINRKQKLSKDGKGLFKKKVIRFVFEIVATEIII